MNRFGFVMAASLAGVLSGSGMACADSGAPRPPQMYSAQALYNEGNHAARSGNPAMAVLDYERARLLAPDDADIRKNLRAVQASAGVAPTPVHWFAHRDGLAPPNVMYWLGVLGLVVGGGGLLGYRLGTMHRKPLAVAAIMGIAMVVLSIGDAIVILPTLSEAVVMQASSASASPVLGAEPQFTLPAAEVVHIRVAHKGFLLIRDSQDREGWIPRSNVTRLIPAQEPGANNA